jgi:alpha-tubulin suppressor-like RCC1 family protein
LGPRLRIARSRLVVAGIVAAPLLTSLAAVSCIAAAIFVPSARGAGGTGVGWGYNYYGQLGIGTTSTTGCECVPHAAPIIGSDGLTQLSSSGYHSLGLFGDGTVKGWGYNDYGQATNSNTLQFSPIPTQVSELSNVVAVAAGSFQSMALLADGTVMAWGQNQHGQLGMGETTGPETCNSYPCRRTPIRVPGLTDVIAIAAGNDFNLALLSTGRVMAWGFDESGQLGDGIGLHEGCKCVSRPVPVPGISDAVAISADYNGTALIADGSIRDWGYNGYGELGNGVVPANPCVCDSPVTPSGIVNAKWVAPGADHTVAALGDGSVMAWGSSEFGRLGIGTASKLEVCGGPPCSKFPVVVPGLTGVRSVGAGYYNGLALIGDATARAWGYNEYGELGDETQTERDNPVPVSELREVSSVVVGEFQDLAIVGPSQTLSVAFAGAGSGRVGTAGLVCPASNCSEKLSQGQVKILRASSTAGGFAGFSGPCAGTRSCQVTMSQDQTVTATFGVPKGTAITAATVNSKKKKATISFSAPGAISGYECKLVKPKPKPKKHKKKAKPAKFHACTGPAIFKKLKPGKYTFEVRALDILGADAVPAVKKFTVKKPKHRAKAKAHKP